MTGVIRDGHMIQGQPLERWVQSAVWRGFETNSGMQTPPMDRVDAEILPLVARVDHARWIADCRSCGAAMEVWLDCLLFWCGVCGNRYLGGAWRAVTIPDWDVIDHVTAMMQDVPEYERIWDPARETVDALLERLAGIRQRYGIA